MSIKRMLASAALILPIAVTFIPFQADAQIRRPVRRSVPASGTLQLSKPKHNQT
ncbi:hypothetical protein [Nostoc sp. NMS9]|uniref:hypothetical protein n=1 Tax=Nostoc sp. NMS9 TaxID=2815393 RepID=UPI0025D6E3D5|nr:hypothetical protein [Nostoc sp. NMS9]MBN3941483.1 hypothetical protein [Nostoc sp. NMS9]